MSNITFENIAAQIAAGTITATEINNYTCGSLTNNEKLALLVQLADKLVLDGTPTTLAAVQSGLSTGPDVVEVPNFLTGRIQMIDTDFSATPNLDGTHQFVDDTEGDSYPEDSIMDWGASPGQHYNGRSLTIPVGVKMLYTFSLKD